MDSCCSAPKFKDNTSPGAVCAACRKPGLRECVNCGYKYRNCGICAILAVSIGMR